MEWDGGSSYLILYHNITQYVSCDKNTSQVLCNECIRNTQRSKVHRY
jgi:hypothetical protein